MGERWTEEGFRDELARRGEHQVRLDLAGGMYGGKNDEKYQIAQRWLWELEMERAISSEAATASINMRLADAAESEAEISKELAQISRQALITARIAAAIAAMALIVSIVGALRG